MNDTRLDDYAGRVRPPILHVDSAVTARTTDETVALRGPVPARQQYGVALDVASGACLELDSRLAFPARMLEHVHRLGCKVLLVTDERTGVVWEYHVGDVNDQLPKAETPIDARMHYAEKREARRVFEDHADEATLRGDSL